MSDIIISTHPRDQYVPMNLFGKDHWSTFGYVETRLVDHGGFSIAVDPRMRTLAHNHRIFTYRPTDQHERQGRYHAMLGKRGMHDDPNSDNVKYGSFLNDGTRLPAHDDWDCIQDLAHAGLLIGDATEEPLRVFDAKSLDDIGKIVASDDYAIRLKLAEFVRDQLDYGLDVGAKIYFTAEGFRCAGALRKHKATGGHFHGFRWPVPPTPSDAQLEQE